MRKLLTLALITLFITNYGLAQRRKYPLETNYWYFGTKAGLRFNPPVPSTGKPVTLGDATLLDAGEGTTAISDTAGNLLFYVGSKDIAATSPSTVFNKNHQIMENGDDIIGGSSCTQNAIALRQPGNFSKYYVFSVAQDENWPAGRGKGFYYTVVDMTANGGLGRVDPAQKNVLIIDSAAEKVSAVLHRNGQDLWIITHRRGSNQFVAVRLSASGVSAPVITSLGIKYDLSRGAMKFSPNGNRVASCVSEDQNGVQYVQVGRFDNLTGDVYDLFHIPYTGGTGFGPFGVEFSSDNSKLYVGDRQRTNIYQYNLCAGDDSTSIINSKFEIETTGGTGGYTAGTLQLGMDGVIYISKVGGASGGYLAAITNPNSLGAACGHEKNYVQLPTGASCDRGLTNVNQSVFNDLSGQIETSRLCERDTVHFQGSATCLGVNPTFSWHFGDPNATGPDSVGTGKDTVHFYSKPGTYTVRMIAVAGNLTDTVYDDITVTALARGVVAFDSLACHQSYRFAFEQDTTVSGPVDVTNYRWRVLGWANDDDTADFIGVDKPSIEITWDSNMIQRFSLVMETTTFLGETCTADSIKFTVNVNERKGATPIGPDTLCLDPNVPFVIVSPDQPRAFYQWVYGPSSDPASISGQGNDTVRVVPTTSGLKSIRTAFYLDTTNQICYTESAPKRFYAANAPNDSVYVFGDSSICAESEGLTRAYLGTGRALTSTIRWSFVNTMNDFAKAEFLTDTVGDSVRARFDQLAWGRNQYYLRAQEVSRHGCRGPVRLHEVWNACLQWSNVVTPDGDGLNDVFKIGNISNFPENEISIYNRWGKRVYNGKNYQNDPKSMDLAVGIYFYKARVFWEGRNVERSGWFEVNK